MKKKYVRPGIFTDEVMVGESILQVSSANTTSVFIRFGDMGIQNVPEEADAEYESINLWENEEDD